MRRLVLALAVACLAAAGAVSAQGLTPGQMRALGFDLLAAGDAPRALAVADALIVRDAADSAAQILRARALRDMGRDDDARAAAQQAWTHAADGDGSERFGAALAMAQALASAGRRTEAQFWLRRAAQVAPSPQARAVALRDFRYVRGRNPLRLTFSFGIAPSSNVNNGSRHSEIEGFGGSGTLSPDAQALSGWAAQLGLSARVRLAEDARGATHLRFAATRREVRLSAQSKADIEAWRLAQLAKPPEARAMPRTNFNFAAIEAGLQHQRKFGAGAVSFGLTLGHNWFGGESLTDYLKVDLGVERQLGNTRAVFAGVSAERQWRADTPARDATLISVNGGLVQRLASGDRLVFGLGTRRVNSRSPDVRHTAVQARLGWQKAEPMAGVRLEASVSAERRVYDPSFLAPTGRRDLRLDAEVSLTFERMDYMGFAPVLDLRASRFGSNVKRHDGRDLGLTLGFKSVF